MLYGQHWFSAQNSSYGLCVRSANSWHEFRGRYGLFCCCTVHLLFCWYDFLGCTAALNSGRKEGCKAGFCWAHFPDFEIKFAGGDKLYFSTIFLSCTLLKNNKNLSSLWLVFPVGVFPRLISQKLSELNLWCACICFQPVGNFLLCV